MRALGRTLRGLWPHRLLVLGALVSLALATAANLISPQALRVAIDQGITAGQPEALWWATGALLAIAIVRGLFSFTQSYWSEQASQAVAYDLRNALFDKIQRLSFSYHDRAQ